jgi:hypothetical protein
MNDKLFDDFLKEKLGTYDSGAPMHVWERIREKDKDDRKWFFFFRRYGIVTLGVLAVAITGYFSYTSFKPGKAERQTIETSVTQSSNHQNKNTASSASESPADPSSNISGTVSSNQINPAAGEPTASAAANPGVVNPQSKKVKLITDDNDHIVQRAGVSAVAIQNIGSSKRRKASQNKKSGAGGFALNSSSKTGASPNSLQERSNSGEVLPDESLFNLKITGNDYRLNLLQKFQPGNITMPNNKPTCPSVNGPRRNDLYLELYGSVDFTMRSFSTPTGFNNYIHKRKTVEDSRNGFSAGIRLSKSIGENTLLKAGLNYSQINERLRIVEENAKQLTQIITIRTVIRGPGDTLFIRDTSYFEQTGTRYNTIYNRYRFIDIPLMFSYEFGNPDVLSFAVNAGPIINITSFYRGKILDTTLTPRAITTLPGRGPNNWRSNIGIGIVGSFAVYKRFNERTQIFIEPYFRYNFTPVTQNTNFVNQHYNTSGVQFGFRYNLHTGRQRYKY